MPRPIRALPAKPLRKEYRMQHVNILTRYGFPLFSQHFDNVRVADRIRFIENSEEDREWDLVIVFDGLLGPRRVRVRNGGLIFIAGEPPDAMPYTTAFLDQFDRTYCSHAYAKRRASNNTAQYFNNWHFGHDPSNHTFLWTHDALQNLPPPVKTKDISVVMSNLAYLPNHLKRRHFLGQLQERFGERVDVFGRGHRFIPYKDDALLPYRFHICIENCMVPDLWTEKLADPFLGWSVPVYAGCPNVNHYFPDNSIVQLDMDDVEGSLATIKWLLENAQPEYERRFDALQMARQRVLDDHNIATLAERLLVGEPSAANKELTVLPNEETLGFMLVNYALRIRRLAYRRYFLLTHNVACDWPLPPQ